MSIDSLLKLQLAPLIESLNLDDGKGGIVPDCKKFCLAACIQNGVLSPPTAPRTWSDQIESIDKHCSPRAKSGLIDCLEKIEKFKTDHLTDILQLKKARKDFPEEFNNGISELNSPDFAELVHHLISQPFPEKPIKFTADENTFETNKISNSFFSVLNKIAATAICQGLWHSKETVQKQKNEWRKIFEKFEYSINYKMIPIEITDSKGNKIRGTYFKYRHSFEEENRPTVICCNPSGGIYMNFGWMLDESLVRLTRDYDFISFDTQGCGDTTGFPTSPLDLYSDTDCVYQFVRDELKVKPENIHFFGYSLGGNVCANVKAVHPECTGRMVIDRSFSRLRHVIENLCRMLPIIIGPIIFFVPAFLGPILAKIVSLIGWEMEGQEAVEKAQGNKFILHHREDKLMKDKASLGKDAEGYLDLSQMKNNNPKAPIHQVSLFDFKKDFRTAGYQVAEFLFDAQPIRLQVVNREALS